MYEPERTTGVKNDRTNSAASSKPRIAICLTSYNRLDCTRINQEIFKLNFTHPYIVVHASSGPAAAPYLEDVFVPLDNLPHYAGSLSNMQCAVRAALRFNPDFLVMLDGDTWLLDEQILLNLVGRLARDPSLLMATFAWLEPPSFLTRFSMELSEIVRISGHRWRRLAALPRRMAYDTMEFAIQFCIFKNDRRLIDCFCGMQPNARRRVERQWFDCFSAYFDLNRVLRIKEREPVHPDFRFACEPLALHSEHWPAAGTLTKPADASGPDVVRDDIPGKREALLRYAHIRKGESIQRLLHATDLSYYNAGAARC